MNNTCPCVFSILHLMYRLDMPFAICHGVGASRLVDPLGGPALMGPRARGAPHLAMGPARPSAGPGCKGLQMRVT